MRRVGILAVAGALALAACGDGPTEPKDGTYEVAIQGAVSATLKGTATFAIMEDEDTGEDAFVLVLGNNGDKGWMLIGLQPVTGVPGVRTYQVGDVSSGPEAPPDQFYGIYLHGPLSAPTATFGTVSGTVQITAAANDVVRGVFTLSLVGGFKDDTQLTKTITISGPFSATRVPSHF